VVGLLGAEMSRGQAKFEHDMSREIRASHGGSPGDIAIGQVCRTSSECSLSATCIRVDDAPRCWQRCARDGSCPDGQTCSGKHGAKICLTSQ
jgi:hypothetical protein